jgi:hypothetical protein
MVEILLLRRSCEACQASFLFIRRSKIQADLMLERALNNLGSCAVSEFAAAMARATLNHNILYLISLGTPAPPFASLVGVHKKFSTTGPVDVTVYACILHQTTDGPKA